MVPPPPSKYTSITKPPPFTSVTCHISAALSVHSKYMSITSGLDKCNSFSLVSPPLIYKNDTQNSVVRLLTHTRFREHIPLLLHKLHWLPFHAPRLPPEPGNLCTSLTSSNSTVPPATFACCQQNLFTPTTHQQSLGYVW